MKKHDKRSNIAYSEQRVAEHKRGSEPVTITVEYLKNGEMRWRWDR